MPHDIYIHPKKLFINVWRKEAGGWVCRSYKPSASNLRRVACYQNLMAKFATGEKSWKT